MQNRDIFTRLQKASAAISDCFEGIAVLILLNSAVAELLNIAALLILYLEKNMLRVKSDCGKIYIPNQLAEYCCLKNQRTRCSNTLFKKFNLLRVRYLKKGAVNC